MTNEKARFEELRKSPPSPPWVAFPQLDRYSIGWRMGDGETHLYDLYIYLTHCSQEERTSYIASFPEPPAWEGWYANRQGLEIDGADLLYVPEETRVSTHLSGDRSRLAVIGQRSDGLFRVRLYSKTPDPGIASTFWGEVSSPSIVDSRTAAEQLAEQHLKARSSSVSPNPRLQRTPSAPLSRKPLGDLKDWPCE